MNQFVSEHLIDAYHYNKDHLNYCKSSAELFMRPYFYTWNDYLNKKRSTYAESILSKEKNNVALLYAKSILPYYGLNKKKINEFTNFELLKSYVGKRAGFNLSFESVIAHNVLFFTYQSRFKNIDMDEVPLFYKHLVIFKSILLRIKLQKIAHEFDFKFYTFPLIPLHPGYEKSEALMIRLISAFRRDK